MAGYQSQPADVGPRYAESSQATLILILGIIGLMSCQLLSVVAWFLGNRELKAIDSGRRSPADRQMANVGRILGIVGTIFGLLVFGFVISTILRVFLTVS